MKNKRIMKAYDSINPDNQEKNRMLNAILYQSGTVSGTKNGRRAEVYTAQPQKNRVFPTILALAACLVMVIGAGFLLKSMGQEPENPAFSQQVETESTPETSPDNVGVYADVLALYYQAIEEGWDAEICAKNGMSCLTPITNEFDGLYYAIEDLDGNGVEELIISQNPYRENWDTDFCDLYTVDQGSVKNIMSIGDMDMRSLCQGGIVKDLTPETEGYNKYAAYYRLSGSIFDIELTVYQIDGSWFIGKTPAASGKITEEEVQTITAEFKPAVLVSHPIYEPLPNDVPPDVDIYDSILQTYSQALQEDWNPGVCVENGISLMVGYYGELFHEIGYALMDLDGNGVNELIITDGNYIYDLYTIIDDEEYGPLRLLTGSERMTYNLMEYNRIFCWGSGGAAVSYYTFSVLDGRELHIQEGYMYDADTDPENPWFFYDGEHPPKPCGEFDAEAVVNGGYPTLEIPFTPFE